MPPSRIGTAKKRTVRELACRGKRVLVRVDFNVPLDEGRRITDDTRIRKSLPTIRYLLEQGARVIVLMSHLGRPKGAPDPRYSLAPVAERLQQLLGRPVQQLPGVIGPEVEAAVNRAKPGTVLLLENLRFHPGEEANDRAFAEALARLGDCYVNDAFGAAHRAHASTEAVATRLPAAAGLLLETELTQLSRLLESPEHPYLAVLGGAKVSDKIGVITNLLGKVDRLLVGGAMAYTFLRAQGVGVGASRVEAEKLELARQILDQVRQHGRDLWLPEDHRMVRALEDVAVQTTVDATIPDGWLGVDIGPKTAERFAAAIRQSRTILWNGPMGIFEEPNFRSGTQTVAEAIAASGAVSILGGGDTVAAAELCGVTDRMSHVSTGGGASLEFLEGRELPGVAVLPDA